MDIGTIRSSLRRHGLTTAERHFEQVESAIALGSWEAANSQIRAFLEALYDAVATIRLKTSLKGGSARKCLAEGGLFSKREDRFLQAFMDWAGEKGAHAGLSSPAETASRRLIALAIAARGLALLPDLVRVEDVLAATLTPPPGTQLPRDREAETICPTCRATQNLEEADARRDGDETVYYCKNGCQPIVVVGLPGDSVWPGRGFRLGPHVIRNAADLLLKGSGMSGTLLMPASPAALMRKRSNSP
jgi:hypothetical protein